MNISRPDQTEAQGAWLSLKKHWAAFALAAFVLLAGIFVLLLNAWETRLALRWLVTASLGTSYLLWALWRNLDKNHRPGEVHLLPTLGPGNSLTLLRGTLLAILAGFLLLPQPQNLFAWAPAIIFTLAIATDFFDGFAARVSNHVTRLGETLDMCLDGLGVLIAILLAVQYAQLPAWYLLVALARYLFIAGVQLRAKRGATVHELPPSVRRRAFAGLQMGFVSAMLWPILTPPGTTIAAFIFAIPFLSGFLLDWLYVSGVIQVTDTSSSAVFRGLAGSVLPIIFRLALAAGAVLFIRERFFYYSNRTAAYSAVDLPTTVSQAVFFFVLETIVMVLLVIGAAGRVTSIAGLLLLGVNQVFGSLHPLQYLLIVIYICMIYLGTGPYSLWKPEDRLIYRHVGEARQAAAGPRTTAPSGD